MKEEQIKIEEQEQKEEQQAFKRCPLGGMCFNPVCAFGCIEY